MVWLLRVFRVVQYTSRLVVRSGWYVNNFDTMECLASELVNLSLFCCWLAHIFCGRAMYGGCFPPGEIKGD